MTEHTVTAFDDDLRAITGKVVEMGGHAEALVSRGVKALLKADRALAQSVIADDAILDNLQFELDERALLVIAKRQPMASDLREVIGSMRIAADLERIGDMGKNIAKRAGMIDNPISPRKLAGGLEHLTSLALGQVKDVLDAFVARDAAKADRVCEKDDEIDNLYTSLFRELLTYMMEDPRNITVCTHLLFCAKNMERIGDHATNIAETVSFMVTGHATLSKHGSRATGG